MLTVRRADEIYRQQGGWFDARWHFSFDQYRDPEWSGVGALRVFNDDRLIPGAIWPMHPHRDIEGLTYVVEGTFRHEDSLGGDGVLPAGSVQRMTLGSGALHSEQNGSDTEPMRFIQLWILPDAADLPPSCEQKVLAREDRHNGLLLVFSPDGTHGSVMVHQDATVEIASLDPGWEVSHLFRDANRAGYLYLIEGRATVNGEVLATGDALRVIDEENLSIRAEEPTEVILVDVPLRFERVGLWARIRD